MKLFEMEGFLRGKCLPGDMKVNETNAEYLVRKFAEADAKCAALAAENAGLKAAHPQPFGEDMMRALEAYEWHQDEVPETGMLDAFFILRDSIRVETPATEAIMAEVRAQGVEMFADNLLCPDLDGAIREFAAQLRKGVQS
ncbi:hypothetical protein ACVGXN_05840 [Enterobacter hormaechei]|jgi:hypothetical protein|uniref:hypothetical protein n=1 Tax=Enterobacter hormaechei TaxID=158836 RepID=UPI000792BD69|nr:hypothetical protein [Enterobacter hormaechei]MCE1333448.1 hypothetical protein [Enterobacter hormaechei]MDA4665478.1 hypothetical protein [Enterobacter hormaechei]TXV90795.1 hypothetical protein D4M63_24235 [Enterobacter hormaechei]CZW49465.1 Uncharacterised protein [Enterobacter hormaechei]CZY05039.1 Uncharacterised protein [Enterobacter hormaechei]